MKIKNSEFERYRRRALAKREQQRRAQREMTMRFWQRRSRWLLVAVRLICVAFALTCLVAVVVLAAWGVCLLARGLFR